MAGRMDSAEVYLPPIGDIKELIRNVDESSTSNQACLITNLTIRSKKTNNLINGLALPNQAMCFHLSKDQDTLMVLKGSGAGLPSLAAIPTMREVLSDSGLLKGLISLLTPSSAHPIKQSSDGGPPSYEPKPGGGRKRSPSDADSSDPTPLKKNSNLLPPTPSLGTKQNARLTVQKGQISEKNISVLAASILFTVFQHVECWPAELLRAFAEDTFGPRYWVGEEKCKAFVANFEVSLKTQEFGDALMSSLAEQAEAHYASLFQSSGSTHPSVPKRKESKNDESSDASSSGDEEVLESDNVQSSSNGQHKGGGTGLEAIFDMKTSRRVRSRYTPGRIIHDNTIADALQSRLDLKSKQNYRLLETLPLFLSIRRVRSLSSSYLERWLNSPALAGLGRTLLTKLIGAMECADPPTHEDVSLVQNVLALRLKANQLSMQIDQTSSIVKKMRSQAVAEMIFTHCLRGECSAGSVSNALKPSDDHLRMLRSAYAALGDSRLAANALALSMNGIASSFFESSDGDVHSHFGVIIRLVSAVVKSLGKLFNGFYFVESFIHISSGPATAKKKASIKTSARLIFEFTLLLVGDSDKSEEEVAHFRQDMLRLRKQILMWCLESLCPAYFSKISREEQVSRQGACYKRGNVTEGPGAPDWQSALVESSDQHTDSPSTQKLFTIMRCMLFAAISSSPQMSTFAAKVNEEDIDDYRCKAIDCLCRDGVDVDDEMLFVVTKASSLTPSSKIAIIENLLVSCGTRRGGRIVSCRPGTVKELFKATEYRPVFKRDVDSTSYNGREFPKLAIASLWWRVTGIALILSGSVPEVGKDLWNSQPNIRSLIKMTTSQKYRFPTADCTKKERESAKHEDQRQKEEEREIVRFLFAPPQQKKKATMPEGSTALQSPLHRRGLRSSARQRAKKERIYAMEQLRKEEEERQERLAIAKSLKSLSRNVQIYDLSQPARKPPKTFVEELLLPAVVVFGLPLQFQQCSEPDFLMKTIGEGRGAVERSYDWLIPVISSHPEIIDRLGSLTTCFLVLRAYGDEGSSDLLRLASPLLENLKTQLTCGHEQSLQTLELLLVDLSGEQRSRRICSHRVLQEIVGSADDWLDKVVALNGSPEILPLVVHYVRHALAFESGLVLGNYLSALSRLMKRMNDSSSAFVLTLCRVISARPNECISVLDENATLKKLALSNVEQVFDDAKSSSHGARDAVSITIRSSDVVISYSVLHTAIVLLSCWDDNAETEHAVRSILHHLLVPFQDDGERRVCGLSSVKPESAISAKHWVLLAQSRSDTVATQAALLAPHAHLARLLCVSNKSQIKVILDRIEPDPDRWDDMFSDSSWPDCASLSSMQAKRRVLGLIRVYERNLKKHRAFVSWLEKCEQTDQGTLSRNLLNGFQLEDRQDDNAVEDLMVDDTTMNSILDDADDDGEVWNCEPVGQKPDKPITPGAISKQFIQSCLESGNFDVLEMSLHLACQDPQSSKSHVDAAAYILDMHTQYNNDSFASSLLKVAELTQCAGGKNLWKRIFSPQGQNMPLQMSLVQRCALSWSDSHVASCVDWIILSKQSWNGVNQLKLVLRFLSVVSEERSSLCFNFITQEICYTQDQAVVITSLALSLAVLESSGGGSNARNLLPDWLILILIIAKTHLPAVIEAVLVTYPSECPVIAEVVLRLYLAYPDDMKFSAEPNLQILLLQASENNQSWRRNGPRCPLDNLICEVFSSLSHQQHIQAANDLAKKHPLLIARHMSILEHGLEQDASGRDEDGLLLLKRGRVGGNILQAMPAVVGDRNISVTIVRWGYTFNESVWCTTLDVMLALPNEILFGLCDHVSLVKVLDLCLKLLMVQIVELNAENVITETREKYKRLIKTFHEYKRDAYSSWISRDLSGWGGIETLLHSVSCKLSCN